jgi:hypothetical protein
MIILAAASPSPWGGRGSMIIIIGPLDRWTVGDKGVAEGAEGLPVPANGTSMTTPRALPLAIFSNISSGISLKSGSGIINNAPNPHHPRKICF